MNTFPHSQNLQITSGLMAAFSVCVCVCVCGESADLIGFAYLIVNYGKTESTSTGILGFVFLRPALLSARRHGLVVFGS